MHPPRGHHRYVGIHNRVVRSPQICLKMCLNIRIQTKEIKALSDFKDWIDWNARILDWIDWNCIGNFLGHLITVG